MNISSSTKDPDEIEVRYQDGDKGDSTLPIIGTNSGARIEAKFNNKTFDRPSKLELLPRYRSHYRSSQDVALHDNNLSSIPRLIKRNLPHHQSKQQLSVLRKNPFFSGPNWAVANDWFHIMLRWSTSFSLLFLLTAWTVNILFFALIYKWFDESDPKVECGLGEVDSPISFNAAFAFSLETCTTVGYGLPNSTNGFFEPNCGVLQVMIYFQMVCSMMSNAFLFAFFFARLGRCDQRGVQVLFSNKAIIEKRNGKWMIHFRVYDMDSSQPLVEASTRMYCASWKDYTKQKDDEIQPQLLQTMRILHPNDEFGAALFTSIPTTVTHHIDAYSPVAPAHIRKGANVVHGHGLCLREVDDLTESRTGVTCPVCGEAYGTLENLKKHVHYNKLLEEATEELPVEGSHCDPNIFMSENTESPELTMRHIKDNLVDKEIICVVEAIEPTISGTFQALQSYRADDIEFGGKFAPCMSQNDGKVYVDMDKFHQIVLPSEESQRFYIDKES